MRKHLPLCLVWCLFFLVCLTAPPVALAADVDWHIQWKDDGTLEEKVSTPDEGLIRNTSGWEVKKQGANYLYQRIVPNWESYEEQSDRLPIHIHEQNYILLKTVQIEVDPWQAEKFLENFKDLNGLDISLSTSGIIQETSGKRTNETTVHWLYPQRSDLLHGDSLIKIIQLDGFMLGLSILALGVIGICIFFAGRLRKVDRMIDEIYSLENVDIEEPEK